MFKITGHPQFVWELLDSGGVYFFEISQLRLQDLIDYKPIRLPSTRGKSTDPQPDCGAAGGASGGQDDFGP
jgi:hypothetical protein